MPLGLERADRLASWQPGLQRVPEQHRGLPQTPTEVDVSPTAAGAKVDQPSSRILQLDTELTQLRKEGPPPHRERFDLAVQLVLPCGIARSLGPLVRLDDSRQQICGRFDVGHDARDQW